MGKKIIILLCIVVGACLVYLLVTDKSKGEVTAVQLAKLEKAVKEKFPKETIKAYQDITQVVIKHGIMSKDFLKDGKAENVWGGGVVVQVFPPNAWEPGVGATINFVLGSIPQKDCSELVRHLGNQSAGNVYQINVEPKKKILRTFPGSCEDCCSEGLNSIGYTVYAR